MAWQWHSSRSCCQSGAPSELPRPQAPGHLPADDVFTRHLLPPSLTLLKPDGASCVQHWGGRAADVAGGALAGWAVAWLPRTDAEPAAAPAPGMCSQQLLPCPELLEGKSESRSMEPMVLLAEQECLGALINSPAAGAPLGLMRTQKSLGVSLVPWNKD